MRKPKRGNFRQVVVQRELHPSEVPEFRDDEADDLDRASHVELHIAVENKLHANQEQAEHENTYIVSKIRNYENKTKKQSTSSFRSVVQRFQKELLDQTEPAVGPGAYNVS